MISAAEKAVADAKKAIEDAQSVINLGSAGFFADSAAEDASAREAYNLLTKGELSPELVGYHDKYTEETRQEMYKAIRIGSADSSTSLENVKRAIEQIRRANTLRRNDTNFPNLVDYRVSDIVMAMAELNADYQDGILYNTSDYKQIQHTGAFATNENLVFHAGDRSVDAFYEEKEIYDKGQVGKYADDDAFFEATGHYQNLVQKDDYTVAQNAYQTKAEESPLIERK